MTGRPTPHVTGIAISSLAYSEMCDGKSSCPRKRLVIADQ